MNTTFLIPWSLAFCCLNSCGQTNSPPIPCQLSLLPPPQIQPLTAGFKEPVPARALASGEAIEDARGGVTTEAWGEIPLELRKLEISGCHDLTESDPAGESPQPATILREGNTNATVLPEKVLVSSAARPDRLIEPMTLTYEDEDLGLRIYRRLERGGYLTRPEPRSDNVLVRSLEAIFEPEVVHIGGVSVSCSIITAIKRRNPLCLINPMVLHVAW